MKKVFLCVAMMLSLTGCDVHVTRPQWEKATTLCSNNGGVEYVKANLVEPTNVVRALCINGAKFNTTVQK